MCLSSPVGRAARTAATSRVRSDAYSSPKPSKVTKPTVQPRCSTVPMTMNEVSGLPSRSFVEARPRQVIVICLPTRSISAPA